MMVLLKTRSVDMYTKMEKVQRMHEIEAVKQYPNSYIVMRMDGMESQMGEVMFVCDTESEAVAQILGLDDQMYCGVLEGQNFRRSLGGVVVNG
jgi:hypothetical protein